MQNTVRRLAAALADAFLAGLWTASAMRAGAVTVLGARHAWVRRLVDETLRSYHRPPVDRPRELARFIGISDAVAEVLRRAERRRRSIPVPVHRIPTTTAMVGCTYPVQRLDHVGQLADALQLTESELAWFADNRGMNRRSSSRALHHYRSGWVASGGGRVRLLEAPLPRLKSIQRFILRALIGPVPVHPAAHGFVPGRSVRTGARPHVGAEVVISLDLESFFAAVTAARVFGVFRAAGFPEPVAYTLTGLCTHASPVAVLSKMPSALDGAADNAARFRLRRALAAPHLPQGAPTSPQLANLCAFGLDRRLAGLAGATGVVYTRYADDLTFSGDIAGAPRRRLVAAVEKTVRSEGFVVNQAKTRIRTRADRQSVTGVVVNERTTVPRGEYDRLRAILHNCAAHGPAGQNRASVPDFRSHLRGRIAWVGSLDPERGRRLQGVFDRIDWH